MSTKSSTKSTTKSTTKPVTESDATAPVTAPKLVGRLCWADGPDKAKFITEVVPERTFPATHAGLAAAAAAGVPGQTLYVIRGSKAVEVAS